MADVPHQAQPVAVAFELGCRTLQTQPAAASVVNKHVDADSQGLCIAHKDPYFHCLCIAVLQPPEGAVSPVHR
jgi:hypothetical protein